MIVPESQVSFQVLIHFQAELKHIQEHIFAQIYDFSILR